MHMPTVAPTRRALLAGLAIVVLASACGTAAGAPAPAPTDPPAGNPGAEAPLEDGTHTGRIRGVDASTGKVTVDPAEVLSGEEAKEAAREDGVIGPDDDLPNDIYIRDPDATTVTLDVAPGVTMSVYDCTGGCELTEVDFAAFAAGDVRAFNGAEALFVFEVEDGAVVSIAEVYVP